jgi:transcriptional regulator with XRE-family HTH domain
MPPGRSWRENHSQQQGAGGGSGGAAVKRGRRLTFVDGAGFKEARLVAGLTRHEAAAAVGVTERTIRNWEARRVRVPYSAFRLMRIASGYALPDKDWAGWCLRRGVLWSPSGQAFDAGGMGYLSLVFRMARQWRREHSTWSGGLGACAGVGDANASASDRGTGGRQGGGFPIG